MWSATRAALRTVLEEVTLADVAAGTLPAEAEKLLREPGCVAATLMSP